MNSNLFDHLATKFPPRHDYTEQSPSDERVASRRRLIKRGVLTAAAFFIGLLTLAYLWRPLGIIHGPALWLYKYPLIWFAPLLSALAVGGLSFGLAWRRRHRRLRALGSDYDAAKAAEDADDKQGLYGRYYRLDSERIKNQGGETRRGWWRWPAGITLSAVTMAWLIAILVAPMADAKRDLQALQLQRDRRACQPQARSG